MRPRLVLERHCAAALMRNIAGSEGLEAQNWLDEGVQRDVRLQSASCGVPAGQSW